jgi:hypothetical protein
MHSNYLNLYRSTCILMIAFLLITLSGCVNYGQSLMISKGNAGAMAQIFGSQASFCKITSSDGVVLTNADHEAFAKYCGEK